MSKRALILGITGQDGSYLADILLERGYQVHGMYRRSSTGNFRNIEHCLDKLILHQGDMSDPQSVQRVLQDSAPPIGEWFEIYNEADQDHVGWSYKTPALNYDITFGAVGRLLEMVRNYHPNARVFIPCSAMMFGSTPYWPQTEDTPFCPQSPYACAKVGAYYLARHYRETYGMFVSTAILYNHDSPRRSEEYLLNKICRSAVRIKAGLQEELCLGSLDAYVDIGHARDYMVAAHQMLQMEMPIDLVIGSGHEISIRQLVHIAFGCVGVENNPVQLANNFAYPGPRTRLLGNISRARMAIRFSEGSLAILMQEIMSDEQKKIEPLLVAKANESITRS